MDVRNVVKQAIPVLDAMVAKLDVTLENMTQVQPKVVDPSGKLQNILKDTYIGCRGRERSEPPHVTIRNPDGRESRIEIETGVVMEGSRGNKEIVKLV